MKKALSLFSMLMIAGVVATAQQNPPAPKIETVRFPPPKVVKDKKVERSTKKNPEVNVEKFQPPTIVKDNPKKKPKAAQTKLAPPIIVKDANVKGKAKKEPVVEEIKFAKPKKTPPSKSESIPNQ